jgi:hypothetical protein
MWERQQAFTHREEGVMKKVGTLRIWTAGMLLSALAIGALAPMAQADHGRAYGHYKYRRTVTYAPPFVRSGYPMRRVIVEHRSGGGAGPVLAGFIGGLVLGSAIQSHPVYAAPPPPSYYYYDPYARVRYSTLDDCDRDARWHRHPRVVQVIEVRSGDCIGSYSWQGGRWCEDDRDGGRGYSRERDDDRDRNYQNDDRDQDQQYRDDQDDEGDPER